MLFAETVTRTFGRVTFIVILIAAALYIVANLRKGKDEIGSEIELAPNRKPYYTDEELETKKLDRTLLYALGFLVVCAVGLPLYWLHEPARQTGATNGFDKRFDPAASTEANVAYLNDQFSRLNNDLELTVAAYNGGESRMARLSRGGERHFWDPSVFGELAPETREYVPMVLAAAWLFLHPDEYGIRFPQIDERPGEIVVKTPMSLNELSICLGQDGNDRGWYRTLRNLNARWDPNKRLAEGTRLEAPARAVAAYGRHCTGSETVARLQALQDAQIPGINRGARVVTTSKTHTVAKGETLSTIARKHGCSNLKDIATVNGLAGPNYPLREGQTLRVPECRA